MRQQDYEEEHTCKRGVVVAAKAPKRLCRRIFPSRVTFEPGICNPMDINLCEHERNQNKGAAQKKKLCSQMTKAHHTNRTSVLTRLSLDGVFVSETRTREAVYHECE